MSINQINPIARFTLTESIISLALFSLILMLFLPGLVQHVALVRASQSQTERWRLAYHLAQAQAQPLDQRTSQDELYLSILQDYQDLHADTVVDLQITPDQIYLAFSQEEVVHVRRQ